MWQKIPAICTNCGKISFELSFQVNTELVDVKGPVKCPYCGGRAELRHDVYKIINNIIQDVKDLPIEKINEIKKTLEPYNQPLIGNFIYINITNEIVEKAPELRKLKDFLPKTAGDLYTLIGIIFVVLTYIQTCNSAQNTPTINQIIEIAFPIPNPPKKPLQPKTIPIKSNVSRNEPCPCGSGKKYKNCHGGGK